MDHNAGADTVPRATALAHAIQRGQVMRDTLFLNNIIDAVADPIFVKDAQLRFVLVNQALCEFTGVPRERFIGRTDADLVSAELAAAFNAIDRQVLGSGQPSVNEEAHTHADGSARTIRTTKTIFFDEDGNKVLVGIFTDLTALRATQRELEAANARLHDLAHQDRLTGLPNRMHFEEALAREVAAAERRRETFAVLFMDLNGFKHINDTYGHNIGDELIRQAGARLAQTARRADFVARLGGDEFVVVARDADDGVARRLAERLAGAIERPFVLSSTQAHVSASVGIAIFPRDGAQRDELIKNADAAMYRAKRVTRQAVEFYDQSQSQHAKRLFLMEQYLRRDVAAGRVRIHLQPIVDLASRQVLGWEALARWSCDELGDVSPAEFIALAEECRMIHALGRHVLRLACDFIVRHGKAGQYVSVNVSTRQFEEAGFVGDLRQALIDSGARPEQLAVEITESALSAAHAASVLGELRAARIRLMVDDFGVGYSNLMRLQRLPFDVIKIDRCFVQDLLADGSGAAMIRTMIVLAHELKLDVIAEGIEHEHQVRALRDLGVGTGQGYLLGRPQPPATLEAPASVAPARERC
jgi:diguanylate cyclase (GGDEF)-like protein/PAS domain S-box-containing protein